MKQETNVVSVKISLKVNQVVEAAHHKVKTFFDLRPNYNHKEKESIEAGEATLAAVIHFNSNNLGSI